MTAVHRDAAGVHQDRWLAFVAQLVEQFQAGQQVDLIAQFVLLFSRASGNADQMEHHVDAVGQHPAHQCGIGHAAEMTAQTGVIRQTLQVPVQHQQRTNVLAAQIAPRQ
ncbi:hypothetical protein D3C86_1416150 [compost metagenome]